jgi:hypothetical protein
LILGPKNGEQRERVMDGSKLAALVPRPRLHLIRFHDVLASNAQLRPEIIPPRGAK